MTGLVTNGPRWALVWDDDGPSRPQIPVRNLEDELAPAITFPTAPPHKPRIDHVAAQRHAKYLRDVQGKGELRRRPGYTKQAKHE